MLCDMSHINQSMTVILTFMCHLKKDKIQSWSKMVSRNFYSEAETQFTKVIFNTSSRSRFTTGKQVRESKFHLSLDPRHMRQTESVSSTGGRRGPEPPWPLGKSGGQRY